jgi:hypothetical protein
MWNRYIWSRKCQWLPQTRRQVPFFFFYLTLVCLSVLWWDCSCVIRDHVTSTRLLRLHRPLHFGAALDVLYLRDGKPLAPTDILASAGNYRFSLNSIGFWRCYMTCRHNLLYLDYFGGGGEKGPAADATDAPQPWGLLCNPVIKMIISLFVFPCNGAQMEWKWQRKTEVLGEKPVPVPLCPIQIPHGRTRDEARTSAVGGRRLTVWVTILASFGLCPSSHI